MKEEHQGGVTVMVVAGGADDGCGGGGTLENGRKEGMKEKGIKKERTERR